MKFTSLDLLTMAGVENPGDQFGKYGISISGVVVNKPDHVINLQDAKEFSVMVGEKSYEGKIPETK